MEQKRRFVRFTTTLSAEYSLKGSEGRGGFPDSRGKVQIRSRPVSRPRWYSIGRLGRGDGKKAIGKARRSIGVGERPPG